MDDGSVGLGGASGPFGWLRRLDQPRRRRLRVEQWQPRVGIDYLAQQSDGAGGRVRACCMRSHGVSDFPDPTPSQGGGVAFQITGGPGSDLNHENPRFKAAGQACQSLLAGGGQPAPLSAQKIAAEVEWARCMRTHGVPGFPDPNAQGAFDSSRFDDTSPAFQTASRACASVEPTGPVAAVPGHGSGP